MTWDCESARRTLGLLDGNTFSDEAIMRCMAIVVSSCENVLGRGLLQQQVTECFSDHCGEIITPYRYPLLSVDSMTFSNRTARYKVHHRGGWITFVDSVYNDSVGITYTGGFATIPYDLEQAMFEMLQVVWSNANSDYGVPGQEITTSDGDPLVSSVSITDVGTIRYDNDSVSTSANSSGYFETGAWGWLDPWAHTLQYHRRAGRGLGVSFA